MKFSVIKEIFKYFIIFKKYAGSHLILLLIVITIGGLFESIGLSMLMPLLDSANMSDSSHNQITKLLSTLFKWFGIAVNFQNIIIAITLIFLLKMFILLIQEYFKSNISAFLNYEMRTKIINLFSKISYQFYSDTKIGYINNLVTTEIARALSAFNNFINMIVVLVYIQFYLLACCFINIYVALSGGLIGLLIFKAFKIISNNSRKFSFETSNKNAIIQSLLIQVISSFQYLKSTNTFERLISKLKIENKDFSILDFKTRMLSGILRSVQEASSVMAVCGLLYVMVSMKGNPLSEVLVISLLFQRTVNKVGQFQACWQKFNVHLGGIDTIDSAFNNFIINKEENGLDRISLIKNSLNINNVSFKYDNKTILNKINLSIPHNSMIAITGQSGSGKTTLINLITGLLKPTHGDIDVDGKLYNNIDLESFRSIIGYVSQDSMIYNDTLYNNIVLWDNKNNIEEKVKKACDAVHLFDDHGYFSAGLNTVLGDKGIKLSGGQKQRVLIARELFRSPSILILDEATSSLDSKTEQIVQNSIDALKGELTIIIISHRLSTIKNCDLIYVLKNGTICESGSFADLLENKDSEFSRMVLLQTLKK